MADVLWLCATGNHPVGIVKIYDEIEERWKYYIGIGNGNDPAADVQMILAKGQKSYSLDHILDFLEEDVEKVVRCKDCKHAYINSFSAAAGTALCVYWTNHGGGYQNAIMPQDGYCCYGERREKE